MCTCPEKDLYSVYLDNELSQRYVAQYEAHIETCVKCKQHLQQLKTVKMLLKEDSNGIKLSEPKLEESFLRLQTKLRYTNNIQKTKTFDTKSFRWSIPAIAAIMLFVFVLPQHGNKPPVRSSVIQNSVPINIAANVLRDGFSTVSMPELSDTQQRTSGVYQTSLPVSLRSEPSFATVDVFRPNFDNTKHISVKITLAGIGHVPVTMETSVPVMTMTNVVME